MSKTNTIYIVDDNEVFLKAIGNKIRKTTKCNVKTFATARECLREIESEKPDLILSDYYLDEKYNYKMNGDRMLSRIKNTYSDIPVIMYSSKDSVDLAINLMRIGASDFLVKKNTAVNDISVKATNFMTKIKDKKEEKSSKISLLLFCAVLVSTVLVVQSFAPDLLPWVMVSVMLIGTVVVFFGEKMFNFFKK